MKNVIPEVDSKSMDIVADNISKLKELFPEAFTEGKVDFDALKEVLGDYIDGREERYSFTWNGKSKARMLAQTPSTGTLRPCKEESVDWDTTQNLFIEGDNLEVLKLLQKSYYNKVKMIYIDPPYNTGSDFVYKDNFKDNIRNYKEITGQVDGEGRNISNNPETSGRYHTDWLNMMYPRLSIARNLLRQDGVIMISIDEKESLNLRLICDQIFGEENFVAQFTVVTNYKGRNDKTNVAMAHEYIVVYKKTDFVTAGLPLTASQIAEYKLELPDGRKYKLRDLRKRGGPDNREDRPNMWFPIYLCPLTNKLSLIRQTEDDIEITPLKSDGNDGRWRWGKERVAANIDDLEASYVKKSNKWNISYRVFLQNATSTPIEGDDDLDEDEDDFEANGSIPKSIWMGGEFSTDSGKRSFKKLIPETPLEYPKSVALLKRCIYYGTNGSDIILDFFFGSGTLAQALFEVESENPKGRRFIGVQLPEPCDRNKKHSFKTIADIAKARMRRAGEAIAKNSADSPKDVGFKVFKLDSTNIKPWELDFDLTEQDLEDQISNIKHGREDVDVLYEVLLKYGLDLTLPITEHSVAGQKVFDIGMGALMICLSNDITLDVVEGIAKLKDELQPEVMRVVFKDAGFADDVVKTNAVQTLKQAGIEDVRSL